MEYSAALYMRLSKEDGKSEGRSIGSQRALLCDYAEKNGFFIYGEYIDSGFSGTNFERPAFKKMIDDIESGRVNTVIVKDLSRLGRDYIATGEYTEVYFPAKGVRCISVSDGYDSASNISDIIPFRNILNEMYARDTSRKIRSAFYARMKRGDFVGAFAPYGYKRTEKEKHRLVIDEEPAKIVRRIFMEKIAGKGPKQIAEELDRDGIKTPLEYRRGEKKTHTWQSATVIKILKNEMYIGNMVQGKTEKISFRSKASKNNPPEDWYRVENTHKAIISRELFEKANKK
ncbi:MAG: recombinase family protein [Oscillospiraceae bacterium]|nr:recombinase family protein [Oscillospiraceae bacterium]